MNDLEKILEDLTILKQDLWAYIDDNVGDNIKIKTTVNDLIDFVEELEYEQ